ncbi:MAG: hypothetical protein ABR529_05830 [Actinomycetota bacterium]
MRSIDHRIDGRAVEKRKRCSEVHDPATGTQRACVAFAEGPDVDKALEAARVQTSARAPR